MDVSSLNWVVPAHPQHGIICQIRNRSLKKLALVQLSLYSKIQKHFLG